MNLIIYHGGGCMDGFCAAYLFWESGFYRNAEYHPAQQGDAPPDVLGKDVYILDFSYKCPMMIDIISQARKVVVLDHHKTARDELQGLDSESVEIVFDMEKSGARLAWEYLWNKHYNETICKFIESGQLSKEVIELDLDNPLWIVSYTEDRDLWRWKLPMSREVNAALKSYPMDFELWDSFRHKNPRSDSSLAMEGMSILRNNKMIIDEHVRHAQEIEMAGHDVLCVNATVLFSEIAGELAKDRPFGVCYFDRHDGKRQYSLRSRDGGVDVSEIAKDFGGGGHKNAAGFEVEL